MKHKRNHLEIRFNNAKHKLSKIFRFKRHKQSDFDKQLEIEAANLIRDIESYGFKFFPEHYVKEDVKSLEKIVSELM